MTSTPAHLPRQASKEPPAHAPNAALLIDFDNVTMGIRSDLQTELKRLLSSDLIKGKVAVQRAYADWRRYPQYVAQLTAKSIDLVWAVAYGATKKNATDIRLAIDALELVFIRPEIGTFILLSGDSDFSSLVIKLKEYGKYVIGVGIRESSSDLLIQNCDEYYSYNELAGLTRTTDLEHEPRDPWQLTVEAVKQMTAHNDVMRSDRLKQVMQELDPNFDEKDSGFSRFSKFVVEAAKRGFITLTRLDNGQYEVALGPESGGAPSPTPPPRSSRGERGRERNGAPREPRAERAEKAEGGSRRRGFPLGEAFGMLRQALLGRVSGDDQSVEAEELREAMVALSGEDADALSAAKFPRLLRQAHDAEIIDLSKQEDGGYQVRLRPEAGPGGAAMPAAEPAGQQTPPAERPARSTRFRRGSRGARPAPSTDPATASAPPVAVPESGRSAEPAPGGPTGSRPARGESGRPPSGRSVRGRSGSRGRATPPATAGGSEGERVLRREPPQGDASGRPAGPARERDGDDDGRRRRRRGGRGRGGRGRAEGGPERDGGVPGDAPSAAPPPPTRERPAAESDPHGESFWSRVKRGLIGE